jgi:alpha-L-fucosidase 2
VIIVHGGGWINGHKQMFVTPLFEPLKKAGFTWFTINYRLAPKHKFPAPVEDTFAAIEWVKTHAGEFKADSRRIALIGESAGGHIVAYCGARGKGKTKVAAVVDFYGANDLFELVKVRGLVEPVAALTGVDVLAPAAEKILRDASGQNWIHKGMPPFLFIHGTKDSQVPYEQSPNMCATMKAAGAACEVYTVEGAPHGIVPWEKNAAFQGYKEKMITWLRNVLR